MMIAHNESQTDLDDHAVLSRLFAVLSHPTRLKVPAALERQGPVSGYVIELEALSRNTVLNHLKLLKKFGFVSGSFTTHNLYYTINYEKTDELKARFGLFCSAPGTDRSSTHPTVTSMYTSLQHYVAELTADFGRIPDSRKQVLHELTEYISAKQRANKPVNLVYICTHNSRRSHFGQVWAQLAAHFYGAVNVTAYSGGTEATAFHPNAVAALERAGFRTAQTDVAANSPYLVYYDDGQRPITCFSKVYDHPYNPQSEFAAIMTCSDAEENCPFIPGAELRIATAYDDPKAFDNTPLRDGKYDERCRQIAREVLYVFSLVHQNVAP